MVFGKIIRFVRKPFISVVRRIVGRKETKQVVSLPTTKRAPAVSVHVATTTPSGRTQQVGTYVRSSRGSVTRVSGISTQQAQQVEARAQAQAKVQAQERAKQEAVKQAQERAKQEASRKAQIAKQESIKKARLLFLKLRKPPITLMKPKKPLRPMIKARRPLPVSKLTLTERSDELLSEIKIKGSTPELKRKREILLKEIAKEEKKVGPSKTIGFVEKRRELIRTEKPSVKREAKLAALTTASSLLGFGLGLKELVIHPVSTIKSMPGSFIQDIKETGQLWRISKTEAIVKIGMDILLLKGTGRALKVTGKVGGKARARLSPKFKGIKKSVITIPSQAKGSTIKIKIGGPVKKLAEPLRKQIGIAGKEVTAVSAQANRLVNLIQRTKIVRKPIPGEAKLSISTKKLLTKFDKGRIVKKDLVKLNRRIIAETGREGALLERSFFADPKGRLRPSRLGLEQKEASLRDILSGDVTFRTQKPQVLIFEKVVVEKLPKALKGIENKLKAGKPLTGNEANRLLQFQLKKSGKFKPVGHLTKEPEITLAPGEIIKKVKTIAVTIIEGKRVPIVSAKVVKAKSRTKALLDKASKGKITTAELKQLKANLKRETGFKTSFSRGRIGKPRVRIPKRLPGLRRRPLRRSKPKPGDLFGLDPKKPGPRPLKKPGRRPRRKPPSVRRPPKRRPPKRPPKRPSRRPRRIPRTARKPPRGRPPGRPLRRPRMGPPTKPVRVRAKKRIVKKRKSVRPQSFEVWARPLKKPGQKKKPKLIKVSRVGLSKKRAKDLRNYITDTSLGRTARIKPSKGKPSTPKLRVPPSYSKKTSSKFRKYRIKKGKRIPLLKGKIIERGRFLLDTKQEVKKIGLLKRIKQITPKKKAVKRKPIRRDRGLFG